MRRLVVLLGLAVALVAAGCGGGGESFPDRQTSEGPLGKGGAGVWLFRPAGEPKTLVIYLHGQGGPSESVPNNHQPWIDHLVARGSAVIYPRYELDYERNPLENILVGVRTAMEELDMDDLPALVIGFSRGGALAIEYAAIAPQGRVPVPQAVMSVFPASQGEMDALVDFSTLDPATAIVLMVGDRDTVVSRGGARILLTRLQAGGFPANHVRLDTVRSHGSFVADHLAPLGVSPAAQAAFWRPADRLLRLMVELQ
jgi:pimeloyl-ACP methyl ester carboxylesterase